MPNLLIRQMPDAIHRKIKERAARNQRSINKEILVLLEDALAQVATLPAEPPIPFKGLFKIDDTWLQEAKEEGRP